MGNRRIYLLLISVCCALSCWALHVQPVGDPDKDYTFVDNSGDTIYIFASGIDMRHPAGYTDWYKVDGSLYQSNTDEIFPDDGGYYTLQDGEKEYFYVFSYANYKANTADWSLSVEPKCDASVLTLSGTLPAPLTYSLPDGRLRTVPRTCTVSYTDLAWNESDMQWTDSAAVATFEFPDTQFTLPAIYQATDISLTVDNIAQALGLDTDSVSTTLSTPIAVKSHVTSRTEVRGQKGELTNELERPVDESVLTGSAELRIQFYSNPTPAASFFSWRIYKGTALMYTRNDENLFEVFSEPAAYRVVCTVTGIDCPCETCNHDSTEVTVNISVSDLRVPNVFTPNGDGLNDEFRVQYRSIIEFHCWVYNRWGKLVYEWTDPAKGWDGTINGRPAAEGAYFYVIRARGSDANPNQGYKTKAAYRRSQLKTDEMVGIYQLSGDINLIRGKQ
ncbi:MAG: gliding motility-associated C-terminal domain-containing protein [Paludibacteraceae bacterium]|nr:gliding motility-associated C-terminal domain-containing protein [Paludibacteraceae bacterium]